MCDNSGVNSPHGSPLARYLCVAYALLVAYGSLYPLSAWLDRGAEPFAYLLAPLPRYVTAFDLITNFIAYAPLGFLAALALYPLARGGLAATLAAASGIAFSIVMEALQTYLPPRIPSNLDVLTNGLGVLCGAFIGAHKAPMLLHGSPLLALRRRWFAPGKQTDLGLVLLSLWLFTQLDPETLLFGNGDLRDLFRPLPDTLYAAEVFIHIEAAVVACNLLAVALFAAALTTAARPARLFLAALLVGALLVRTLAFAVLFNPSDMLLWVTPGALIGMAAGIGVAMVAVALPRTVKIMLCGLALMSSTVLVNLTPANPYLAQALDVWQQGQFLNFNGLTHLTSELWPFAALAYVLLVAGGRAANS